MDTIHHSGCRRKQHDVSIVRAGSAGGLFPGVRGTYTPLGRC